MRRWTKAGVLERVFAELQRSQIARIRIESVSLDSTSIKVHPDGTGVLKKTDPRPSAIQRRAKYQDSSGCRR